MAWGAIIGAAAGAIASKRGQTRRRDLTGIIAPEVSDEQRGLEQAIINRAMAAGRDPEAAMELALPKAAIGQALESARVAQEPGRQAAVGRATARAQQRGLTRSTIGERVVQGAEDPFNQRLAQTAASLVAQRTLAGPQAAAAAAQQALQILQARRQEQLNIQTNQAQLANRAVAIRAQGRAAPFVGAIQGAGAGAQIGQAVSQSNALDAWSLFQRNMDPDLQRRGAEFNR